MQFIGLIGPLRVESIELAFDWRQQSLTCNCQLWRSQWSSTVPGCSLLIPFSVWIISLACAITNLPASALEPLHHSICFMSGRFDSLNFTQTPPWSVCVEVRSLRCVFICKFMLFVCAVLSHLPCESASVKYVEFTKLNTVIVKQISTVVCLESVSFIVFRS